MEQENSLPNSLVEVMENPASQAAFSELQRREGKNLPLLSHQSLWNPVTHEFEPSISAVVSNLEMAIKRAQAFGIGLNIDVNNCSWDQVREARAAVEDAMRRAKENYNTKATGSVLRRLFRRGSLFNQTVAPFTGLIPDQMGLNVLRAGLGILFASLERRETNREKIFESFEDIGEILEDAEQAADPKVSPFGSEIKREAVDLCTKVLEGLPELLRIIDHKSIKGHGHDFVGRTISHIAPGVDTKRIMEITERIKRPYARLEHHIMFLCQRRIIQLGDAGLQLCRAEEQILREAKATHEIVTGIKNKVDVVIENQKEMKQQMADLTAVGSNMARSIVATIEDTKPIHEKSLKAINDVVKTAINGLFQTVCDLQRTREYYIASHPYGHLRTHRLMDSPTIEPARSTNLQQLNGVTILKWIGTPNPLDLHHDILKVLSDGTTMEEEVLSRGRWLLTLPRFQAWLNSPQSDYLFVEGDCNSALDPRASSLSVICASILGIISSPNGQHGQTIALGYFCAEHVRQPEDESDTDSTTSDTTSNAFRPLDILRSLISQLITYPRTPVWRFGTDEWSETELASDGRQAARAMIRILRALVAQLAHHTTLYIIIDGLSEFEEIINTDWDELIDVLVAGLIGIGENMEKRGIHVKTLFTCVSRCLALERALEIEDEVQNYSQDNHHISLWAGNVDSRAGVATAFEGDVKDLLGQSGFQSDSE